MALMRKVNCWEYMDCGRQPGGKHAAEKGACPAAAASQMDGVNSGLNAGRFCWVIAGTLCAGAVQGTFAAKFGNCLNCPFLREVLLEEGDSLVFMALGDQLYSLKAIERGGRTISRSQFNNRS